MKLEGIFVPLVTPFAADGSIAIDALHDLAHQVIDDGAAGIVALGTTAEAATLDAAERRQVVDLCAKVCQEREVPLVVGAGSNDTQATRAALAELGPNVSAALVPVPSYTRPGERGVVAHFRHLNSPVPVLIYHVPPRTAQPLSSAALLEIAVLPYVVGIKLATGVLDQQAIDLLGVPDFAVLAGDDFLLSALLALGAQGGITASAHLVTRRFAGLWTAWQRGDVMHARTLGHELARLAGAAFVEPNPTVIKGALHALGRIPTAQVRLPLLPASEAAVQSMLSTM
ncbi:dihydrodipicolinate synthase family protein [Actinocrispum sp. NPDC049592]|uniref:dihydrodipicolinate synthase family protein n=1 Tax=Actinocrispum sp. NPDC049592 TaxID=3154835 RepID=UPI00344AB1D4